MSEYSLGVNDALAVKLWSRRVAEEAIKDTYYARFIGEGPNSLVMLKPETMKGPGDQVTVGLRMTPTGDGVTEGEDLEGNEESLVFHDDAVVVNELSHAMRTEYRMTPQRIPYSVREQTRSALSDWYADRHDEAFFNQLCGYTAQTNTKRTGLNATIAPSSSRRLFASASATTDQDMEASTTNGLFDNVGLIEDMVTLARTVTPKIRPLKVDGREKYVLFLHDYQVRDLRKAKSSSEVTWWDTQAALLAGGYLDNKKLTTLYQGAIGEWNDVIIHRAFRVTNGVHSTTGAAQTSTRRAVLCGAQSAIAAYGKGYSPSKYGWVEDDFDYRRKYGASVQCIYGLKKAVFNSVDFGVITMTSYASASGT